MHPFFQQVAAEVALTRPVLLSSSAVQTETSWCGSRRPSAVLDRAQAGSTEPSSRIAANARTEPWICCTFLSLSWTGELSPPNPRGPHTTTERSSRMAANAPPMAWICCTPFIWSWTAELSPPNLWLPHVTTEPYLRIAANEVAVAWICCTALGWCWTVELSPPNVSSPHVMTEPFSRMAANAHHVAWSLAHSSACLGPQSSYHQILDGRPT